MLTINFLFIRRKRVNYSVGLFSNRNMNSMSGGTAAAVPLPFRPCDPILCGSRHLSPHISVD